MSQEGPDSQIWIYVYLDGTIADEKGRKDVGGGETEEEIESYLAKRKAAVEKKIKGKEDNGKPAKPQVHIRADRSVLYKDIREVTKAREKVGIARVIFASEDSESDAKKEE